MSGSGSAARLLIGGSSAISTSTDTSSSLPSGELRASESSSSGALAHGSGAGERVIGSTWLDDDGAAEHGGGPVAA